MNRIGAVNFTLASLEDFEDRDLAERVIRAILGGPSFMVPKRYGRDDPLTSKINADVLSPLIDLWVPRVKRRSSTGPITFPDGLLVMDFAPSGDYLVHWAKADKPSFAWLSGGIPWCVLKEPPQRLGELLDAIKALVSLVNPVYGDIQNMAIAGWDVPLDLQTRLRDVPWISIYGAPYIEMFTEERILSAPFRKIEKLPSGHFLLQATESPHERVPEETRAAIRRHLGEDAFMSGGRWRYKNGRAPKFDFSKVTR